MANEKENNVSVQIKILSDKKTQEDIYAAYELLNEQVKMFEEFLIMAQQQDYCYKDESGEDIYVSEEEVKSNLRKYIETNTKAKDIDAVMEALKMLTTVNILCL